MLDLFVSVRFWFLRTVTCVLLASLIIMTPLFSLDSRRTLFTDDANLIRHYFVPALEQETEISKMVDLMVKLRNHLISQGLRFPHLNDILTHYRDLLKEDGVFIDDAEFDRLQEEFKKYYEDSNDCPSIIQAKHKHKHKKDKKEVKIGSKTAVGFLKFCAGSLLCLVPVPVIQGAGATLAVIGLNDMVDGQREESDNKDAHERFEANRRLDLSFEK